MATRWVLIVAACLSCLGCQATDSSYSRNATSSAGDPPAAITQAPSAAAKPVVYAYYFHRNFRCVSCLAMEEMAAHAIEENFAKEIKGGQVVWVAVNMEDPANKALQQQLEVRSNGLVVARMENGVCRDSKRLDELWGLKDRPEVFSQFLVDEIKARLNPVQSR